MGVSESVAAVKRRQRGLRFGSLLGVRAKGARSCLSSPVTTRTSGHIASCDCWGPVRVPNPENIARVSLFDGFVTLLLVPQGELVSERVHNLFCFIELSST